HLLEELTELLGRDLVGPEPAGQCLRLAVHHLVLAVREVRLEVGQAVHLLEHPEPFVALLHEAVEVGSLARQRRVLEDGREVAGGCGAAAARPLREVALLEGRPLERVLRELARRLLEQRRAHPLLALLLARRPGPRPGRRPGAGRVGPLRTRHPPRHRGPPDRRRPRGPRFRPRAWRGGSRRRRRPPRRRPAGRSTPPGGGESLAGYAAGDLR